ncbi:MAG: sterol desaturase family protein [Synechococcaceae cyanobacterium]
MDLSCGPFACTGLDLSGRSWSTQSLVLDGLVLFLIILGRYLLTAGGSWWLLRLWGRGRHPRQSGAQRRRYDEGIRHDIRLSVGAAVVFALATGALLVLQSQGLTRLYARPDAYGWWYVPVSYLMVLILQDAVFYVTHRLFHHPALYRWCHHGHHRSRHPTPWTSFAFDPPEAVVQGLFLVAVVALVPLHLITLLAVLSTMTVWAIVNHVDLDHLPRRFPHHLFGRWLIGPAHHCLHHRRPGVHFGLYFTFWDRLCGTEDSGYAASVDPAVRSFPQVFPSRLRQDASAAAEAGR